ncbi:GNAT family N-acetyltransferase [Nesterenkonia sp. E16_7]|uniref:GNAT family N-acetyltransferase n=1 Tax=unclassified Nesterenkonia TaxID=2629769 RepID=UPI001A926EE3|nr:MULTISPECIES: GNAT family N-acetyltransferase [unclassified Nesterenkonia]MBO0594853.1 GNAT family N-acetyltransferase [Nesterenkonia sp. E16_10]MBO0597102.1 GNAT family N-acetyltransferase [Nesterenkonia sp. E16_7]
MESLSEPLTDITRRRIVTAWANALGVPPADIRRDEWVFVERADLTAVVVVRVDGFGLVAAPAKILDRLGDVSRESLLDADALAGMLASADPIGSADLLFAERSPRSSPSSVIPARPLDLATMRAGVSAAEWEESGLEETECQWAALNPAGDPAAIAGFSRWRSELAQMGVLAHPEHRGAGFAYAAAAAATDAALGAGLIAQWRSRQGNQASRVLAQRLGYTPLGVQAAVALNG